MKISKPQRHTSRTALLPAAGMVIFLCARIAANAASENRLTEITVTTDASVASVHLVFSGRAPSVEPVLLEEPPRLLLDFTGKGVVSDQSDIDVAQGLVGALRFEYAQSNLKVKPLDYLMIMLEEAAAHTVRARGRKLQITVAPVSVRGSAGRYAAAGRAPTDIDSCIAIALASNPNIRIAADEVHLARMKAREALRALFPGVTAKYEQTRGDAVRELGAPAFDERTYGVQVDQPLYQGGRLRATYRQAYLQRDIAMLKYDALLRDLVYDVVKAYYEVARHDRALEVYRQLAKNINGDVRASRKRHTAGQSTAIEYSTVESQKRQITYTASSIEKDLALAVMGLRQVLFLPPDAVVAIDTTMIAGEVDMTLEDALRYAALHRQDIAMAQLEQEFADLGATIGRASTGLRIDLSGFAGRSGGAYATETLEMGEDYSAGVTLAKPFGGSTMRSSFLFDKTSPKLGQSTRTQSKTGTVALNLFDRLDGYSDRLEGDITKRQAAVRLLETQAWVEREVQESYFNLQKALLQAASGTEVVALAQKEVVAARSKKDINLAQISELIAAKMKLAAAQRDAIDAAHFFAVSLAGLNRAVGEQDHYQSVTGAGKE